VGIAQDAINEAASLAAAAPSPGSLVWFRRYFSGSDVESAWRAIHRAEEALTIVLPAEALLARLPGLRSSVATSLSGDDRQEGYLKTIDGIANPDQLTTVVRARLGAIKSTVNATSDTAHRNIRNYRNWLLIVSAVVVVGLIAVAIAHAFNPRFISIVEKGPGHFAADVAVLEVAGAIGGLLMAVFALIRLKVYSGPVALPLWQAIVRIPAGAVAGLSGAAFVQGKLLNALAPQDRSGLLAYAFLFGAAPEILLRFLDQKVNEATAAARPKNDPTGKVGGRM
jgi:hypothetical protein